MGRMTLADIGYEDHLQQLEEERIEELEAEYGDLQRYKARMKAILTAVEQLMEELDDDGEHSVVRSDRLKRLAGLARRDREDLEDLRL